MKIILIFVLLALSANAVDYGCMFVGMGLVAQLKT